MFSRKMLFVLALTASSACAQNSLSNDTLVKLVQSGVPDDAVIQLMNSQAHRYVASADELAALKQAGASPQVLALAGGQQDAAGSVPLLPSITPILHDGTPVRLRLSRTLSSETERVSDKVDFDVLDDIRVGDRIVIPRGSKAIGSITEAEPKKRMGRGGKLNMVLEYVRLADDTKVSLRAGRETSGGSHTGAMTVGIVASALVVWPAAPFFLLMHGKEAVILEGTEITSYVNGDVQLGADSLVAMR